MTYEENLALQERIGTVKRGFTAEQISRLNTFKYTRSDEGQCSICLFDFKLGEDVLLLNPCTHLFHTNCCRQWLLESKQCPICRFRVSLD